MNKVHRIIWNEALQMWTAVAENAKGHSKSSRSIASAKRRLTLAALVAGMVTGSAGLQMAHAAPVGGQLASGLGSITQSGNATTINQSTQNLSLNWKSFNVGASETVNFVQPSATAIAVNRIFDTNGSLILGNLNANGQVFLINPNGVIFGAGAQVNVGGLVASTLDITKSEGSTTSFAGTGTGSVINLGKITAANGGYVALLGNQVSNQGVISAQLGTVALGAGSAVTLSFNGSSLLHMVVDQSTLNSLAENGGLLHADAGQVLMTAGAAKSLVASVVNNTGVIEARTVTNHNGTITLLGGMAAGAVNVGGTLDASAPNGGNGGAIETSAAHVQVAPDAHITTAAAMGLAGTWLIDPTNFTISSGTGSQSTSGMGATTLSNALSSGNVSIAISNTANGSDLGDINVNAAVSWSANNTLTLSALNNININAGITSSGSTGKLALQYGQGAVAAGNASSYNVNAPVNLAAGQNFSTQLGSDGTVKTYTVITSLGAAADAATVPATMTLQGMAATSSLAGRYVLGANIDATGTSTWNSGAGFTPIGNSTTAFTSTFDGLGHTVSGLIINRTGTDYIGLFGYGSPTSVIRDLGMVGGNVAGGTGNFIGGLVGVNSGTINNSYTSGNVSNTTGSDIGGLVGLNNGTINNSHATGNVSNTANRRWSNVGGLVGYGHSTNTVSNSYATGAVTGTGWSVGGLIGLMGLSSGTLSNAYATGNVSGTEYVGGLVGRLYAGAISNAYATGHVSGTVLDVGGLVGYGRAGTTISNSYSTGAVIGGLNVGGLIGSSQGSITSSYWNTQTSGTSTSAGGSGRTTEQMQAATSFTGFNFTTTPGATGNNWVMVDTDGTLNNAGGATGAIFPVLASEYSTTINNAHQLQLMAMNLGASYTLGSNVNAAATGLSTDIWASAGFTPIGNYNTNFTGTFDGLGHTISNLTINLPSAGWVGLFAHTDSTSTIQNVGLVGSVIGGSYAVGILAGQNEGMISNSYGAGSVSGSFWVGGLAGTNYGTINNSYSTASASGSDNTVGGLVGANRATISNSYATGAVSGGSLSGGLVGWSNGTISNSYATGSVSRENQVGGLVGYSYAGAISNSHATGNVTGGGSSVGGLVGENISSTISNSYATGRASGAGGNVGGLVGTNYGAISHAYATGNVSGTGNLGGLIGFNAGGAGGDGGVDYQGAVLGAAGSNTVITDSYATGTVTGTGDNVGGLVGLNSGGTGGRGGDAMPNETGGAGGAGGLASIEYSYATGLVTSTGNNVGGLVGSNSAGVAGTVGNVMRMGGRPRPLVVLCGT